MSKNFFNYLNKNGEQILNLKSPFIEKGILKSCNIKKIVIEKDENEKDLRKILNFGHTFAHAYEATMNYSKKLNHGEAVLLGIISASKFAFENNILNKSDYQKIINHFKKFNLPNNIKKKFSSKQVIKIISFMMKDKKNYNDKINLVLPKKIGKVNQNYYFRNLKIKKFLNKELIN